MVVKWEGCGADIKYGVRDNKQVCENNHSTPAGSKLNQLQVEG